MVTETLPQHPLPTILAPWLHEVTINTGLYLIAALALEMIAMGKVLTVPLVEAGVEDTMVVTIEPPLVLL
jgi:hypothetical protein